MTFQTDELEHLQIKASISIANAYALCSHAFFTPNTLTILALHTVLEISP